MSVTKLYLGALSAALVLASAACSAGKHPAGLLPPGHATAPPLVAVSGPAAPPQTEAPPQEEQAPVQIHPKTNTAADPAGDLLAQVEKQYQAGQDKFQAGDFEAAKLNFEEAMDLLADTKLDVHADARLQQEFDKIQDSLKRPELQALQLPESGPEPKAEPAPIDEVNEATPEVDANVKAKAEAEIKNTHSDLPLMMTDQVAGFINYFSGRGRQTLENALTRSGRYQEMIQRVLKQEGVPQDLIYLAQAESGFHPLALSRAGARGMWQFMGSRAKGYGLERNIWVDERQDPEKSTHAAARHLKDLYNQFGDWYLAMAAYNSGPGTIQQAVKRTGYADFWELYKRNVLPKETRNYVPIIVAVTIMAKNPAQYGLDTITREEPVPYDVVKIDYSVDLRLAAQCIDSTPSSLQDLNPSLLRWTTPKDGQFELHLPKGTKQKYLASIAPVPEMMRPWWRYHSVVEGDSLASLAKTYRTAAKSIEEANRLDGEEFPTEGKLLIPIAPGRHAVSEDAQSYARHITRYRVHKGDSVQTVADNFGVPPTMVRRWNHLKSDSLKGRKIVYVHLPISVREAEASTRKRPSTKSAASKSNSSNTLAKTNGVHHTVKAGETLYSIASNYKTTVSALQRANRLMDVASLRPGMVLIVP